MTEMQWSCKTTKFHITLCLILLCSSAGKTGCSEGMLGPERVSSLFAAIFISVFLPAHDICSQSVSSEPGSRWSPLSWQTLEVSQADTNIEHHPHIARIKLSREGT